MIFRLSLILLIGALTGCSMPFFKHRPADKPAATQPLTPKETKARLKELAALIKKQQAIIARYLKQDPADKSPDALLFVTDVEYAEAKVRLAKAQAERDQLAN